MESYIRNKHEELARSKELMKMETTRKCDELSLRETKLEQATSELQHIKKQFEDYVKTSEAKIDVYKYCMQTKHQLFVMAIAEVLLFIVIAFFVMYHLFVENTKLIESFKKFVGL